MRMQHTLLPRSPPLKFSSAVTEHGRGVMCSSIRFTLPKRRMNAQLELIILSWQDGALYNIPGFSVAESIRSHSLLPNLWEPTTKQGSIPKQDRAIIC